MQRPAPHAAESLDSMRPILPQAPLQQPPTSRPTATFSQGAGFRAAPESVSLSEAGASRASIDLSAASNMAANGEDPMDIIAQVGGSGSLTRSEPRGQRSDAEKWFQDSNQNASVRGNVSFFDDDPPFHMPQRKPNDPSTRNLTFRTAAGASFPGPTTFQQHPSIQSSSSGEFRSVIDDLTVENKKLRRKLKQYERTHMSQPHPDKMFEVRMPGLAGKDRQRLERLLKEFANTVSNANTARAPRLKKEWSKDSSHKLSSSSTTHSNPVDSAYASGSVSGRASGSQSQQTESPGDALPDNTGQHSRREIGQSRDANIKSYLQNISQGLLPQRPPAMTERARKKAVVKRLEQLFTGKAGTNAKNSQSQQQQEVSTAAANADQRASEAKGRPLQAEGNREASILPAEAEAALLQAEHSSSGKGSASSNIHGRNSNGQQSSNVDAQPTAPDQRPTRPLDLDLNRAQIPAENLAYIRHLGFQPPEFNEDDITNDEDWVPLNLLTGMAQLHTINVTVDFVRQAVKGFSERLELTSDGSKIRWRGGNDGSRMSGESDNGTGSKTGTPEVPQQETSGAVRGSPSRSRSSKPSNSEQTTGVIKSSEATDTNSGTKTSSQDALTSMTHSRARRPDAKRPMFSSQLSREHSFNYQPIFYHAEVSDESREGLDEDDSLMSSSMREDTTNSGSGPKSQRQSKTSSVSRPKDGGPLIFYHRARFCIDLRGDQGIVPYSNTIYSRLTSRAIGDTALESPPAETKGPLAKDMPAVETYFPEHEGSVLGLDAGEAIVPSTQFHNDEEPVAMPAYGLGGVTPEDNCVFWVRHEQTSRKRASPVPTATNRYRKSNIQLRRRLFDGDKQMLNRVSPQDLLEVKLSPAGPVRQAVLEPSELPEPSYAFVPFSSSGSDVEWDSAEEEKEDEVEDGGSVMSDLILADFRAPAIIQTHGIESESDDEEMMDHNPEGGEAVESSVEDDGEIDMLAQERRLNADKVAEQEREWDEVNRAASPALTAHSSAATVGDQSFLSDEGENIVRSPGNSMRRSVRAGTKREREEAGFEVKGSPAKRPETAQSRVLKE